MKRRKNREIKNEKGKMFLYVVFSAIVFLSSVFLTIKVSTSGAKLVSLESEISRLSKENDGFRRELVSSSSLADLEERVKDTGFVKPQQIIYVLTDKPVAQLQ